MPRILVFFIFTVAILFPNFSNPSYEVFAGSKSKVKLKSYTFGDNQRFKVGFDGTKIIVFIRPRPGEGEFRFAEWTLRDWRNNFKNIRKYNKNRPPQKNQYIQFPFKALNDNMQSLVLQTLFPNDSGEEEEWAHRVVYKGETISLIAGVFAKNEISAQKIIKFNKLANEGRNLGVGDTVRIPWNWVREELNLKPIEVKKPLVIKRDQFGERFAYYTLKKGESLYSSVVIRFTGRTLADDVNRMADKLLVLNNIKDERFIPVGENIKIPPEWISEEYLVKQSVQSEEIEKEIEPEKMKVITSHPVHIIIDPGHGGKDPGAVFGKPNSTSRLFEDETVYDIGIRLASILKERNYSVHMTLQDPNQPKPVSKLAYIKDSDERILVNPLYQIDHVNIGINMRIFLINDIYQQLIRKKVPSGNIVLISLHGDALHKSLQGATVYFPDARLRKESFSKRHKVYRKRKEYKKRIRFPVRDNSRSAILSKAFGKGIIDTFKSSGIKTHSSFSVRGYYYRKGKRTLPGILRYSKIPTSVLVEVGNINNHKDRSGFRKPEYRQKLANALADSIQKRFSRS